MSERFPGDGLPGLGEHQVGVIPTVRLDQSGTSRDPYPPEFDLRLPDPSVRGLTDDLAGLVTGNRMISTIGMLDHKGAHVAVVVASPDDDNAGNRSVADPSL